MWTRVHGVIRSASIFIQRHGLSKSAIKGFKSKSYYDSCQHCGYLKIHKNFSLSTQQNNTQQLLSLKNPNVQKYIKNLATSDPSTQHSNRDVYNVVLRIEEKLQELQELEALAAESEEFREVASRDKAALEQVLRGLEEKFFQCVVEPEPFDHNDVVLEVTGGVGGQEAMLFAEELFRMYEKFSSYNGWEFTVTKYDVTDVGGMRHGHATISGTGVYQKFKYEVGVHRVQRVPKTEKTGRIHTSTATVAILPLPTEVQVTIHPKDLKIEPKKASGAGGQHVNTTESAIRVTHLPTGTVVECQMERSQIRNRELALRMLRARIYDRQVQAQMSQRYSSRKLQVGLAGRSEKIRTYNYGQNRVTDHRIGLTLSNLQGIVDGHEYFNELLQKLEEYDHHERTLLLFSS